MLHSHQIFKFTLVLLALSHFFLVLFDWIAIFVLFWRCCKFNWRCHISLKFKVTVKNYSKKSLLWSIRDGTQLWVGVKNKDHRNSLVVQPHSHGSTESCHRCLAHPLALHLRYRPSSRHCSPAGHPSSLQFRKSSSRPVQHQCPPYLYLLILTKKWWIH